MRGRLSWLTIVSFSTLAATQPSPRSLLSDPAEFVSTEYDYLVVGGGTAGLVIAARLSEDPDVSVGVIEGGQYLVDDPLIDTPNKAPTMQGNPKYDWMFETTPQPGLNNRVINMPRGKVLGGSSAINFMEFGRASMVEYDVWGALGNAGWSWDDLLPYMKKAERFVGTDPFRANSSQSRKKNIYASQGKNGLIAADYNNWYSDVTIPIIETLTKAGVPVNYDPDGGDPFGHYNSALSINRTTGKRSYSANTYYAYNADRPNLVVLTGAQATKVNFANKTRHDTELSATGVAFVCNSATYNARVKREVILSAGAIQSPQLLELSGIGNSTILRRFGISPLMHLPGVGENLQDHLYIAASYQLKPGKVTYDILRNNVTYTEEAQAQYATTHDGIYSSVTSVLSFIDLETLVPRDKYTPMVAQVFQETTKGANLFQQQQYNFQAYWLGRKIGHVEFILSPSYSGYGVPKANTSYVSTVIALQHPFSRGSVHIQSQDPLAKPACDPNYFKKVIDQDSLVEALKFSLKISQTEPLASLIVSRQDPAPDVVSDSDLLEYIKAHASTIWHPIGTVAMAPKDFGGVVDPDLKVYGTKNLRVVDASIVPIHMGAHLARSVYGIAEKAAAIIKSGD